ncbi:MAG TPA: DUF4260 domain-containing protein [Xanthobacteraceae bacterium]|nr:DUF4260 domain-containing protein [Xanthobacteraceae bacterium]
MTATPTEPAAGAATGGVNTLLRIEGLTLFAGMTLLYGIWGGSWWIYVALFFVPDLSFLAYLAGPRVGAITYNAMHTYMPSLILSVIGFALVMPLTLSIAMIWMAHIGIDRALGFGLKYDAGFGFTHLGRFGKAARASS